jgi:hypothetical protein
MIPSRHLPPSLFVREAEEGGDAGPGGVGTGTGVRIHGHPLEPGDRGAGAEE